MKVFCGKKLIARTLAMSPVKGRREIATEFLFIYFKCTQCVRKFLMKFIVILTEKIDEKMFMSKW